MSVQIVFYIILGITFLYLAKTFNDKYLGSDIVSLDKQTLIKENKDKTEQIAVSKKYKWYVIASSLLVGCMFIFATIYFINMTYNVTNIITTDIDQQSIIDLYDIYSSSTRTYLFAYTFALLMYSSITTYAYMITANDCETQGIKYISNLWMGENNNVLYDLSFKWGGFIATLLAKPYVIHFAPLFLTVLIKKVEQFSH